MRERRALPKLLCGGIVSVIIRRHRPSARYARCGLSLHLSVCVSVCLRVAHNHERRGNGLTNQDAISGIGSSGSKDAVYVRLGPFRQQEGILKTMKSGLSHTLPASVSTSRPMTFLISLIKPYPFSHRPTGFAGRGGVLRYYFGHLLTMTVVVLVTSLL